MLLARFRPVAVAVVVFVPSLVAAQAFPRATDGIAMPRARLTIRGGADAPRAQGGFWDAATDQLTLSRTGLGAPSVAAEFGVALGSRVEVTLGAGVSHRTTGSSYRRFVDTQNAEIEQRTALQRVPVVAGMRVNLLAPGWRAGSMSPRRVVPYFAAGGGMLHWRLRQTGDFVDFRDLGVVAGTYTASGWAPTGFGAAGVDVAMGARTVLALDARYTVARGRLGAEFPGTGTLDLASVAVTAGVGWRF